MAKTTRSRAKQSPLNFEAFDTEALGLILISFGLVLAVTMYVSKLSGFFFGLRGFLYGLVGWGSLALPLPFFLMGGLLFMRRPLAVAWRVLLGASLVLLSCLMFTTHWRQDLGGDLAQFVAHPIWDVLNWLAVVPILMLASVGLEIMFAWPTLSLVRAALALSVLGLARVVRAFHTVFGGIQTGSRYLFAVGRLRAKLEHLRSEQTVLEKHFKAPELKTWRKESEAWRGALREPRENEFPKFERDFERRSRDLREFSSERAKELGFKIKQEEDAGAAAVLLETERVIAAPIKLSAANPAANALERLRQDLLHDIETQQDHVARQELGRQTSLDKLNAPITPFELIHEIERSQERAARSKETLKLSEALRVSVAPYPAWPDFVVGLESNQEFSQEVAQAIRLKRAAVFKELDKWNAKFVALPKTFAPGAGGVGVAPSLLNSALVSGAAETTATAGTVNYGMNANAAFTGGITQSGALEIQEVPAQAVVSPSAANQTANPWDVEPRASKHPTEFENKLAPRPETGVSIADSDVGARIDNAPRKQARAGNPLEVPGTKYLDPVQVSALDLAGLDREARARAAIVDETLANFGVQAKVVDFARGPTVTRFELEPAPGEKIARIQSLQNDLARVLSVGGVRIEAPVPGKNVVGLEVPNAQREPITFRAGIESSSYARGNHKLPLLLGKSIDGEMVVGDLARMPHVLIAGSTGSGKSVCVNTLIMSLLYRYLPTQLRFVMIDPKMVELTPYDGIPHLVRPVVTNPNDAAGVLLGCVAHMERRYKMMSEAGAKNLEQYNEIAKEENLTPMPYLVIIIDELADLMITSPKEVEAAIMRLAQMARATGMHLILATQRPSTDIITGLIKVNIPARVAFAVSASHDSRTILDSLGAEKLTGYGDMLFNQPGLVKPMRLQGPYISEAELKRITELLRRQNFEDDFGETYGSDFDGVMEASTNRPDASDMDFSDPLIKKAAEVVVDEGYAAVSRLQRRLSVGHARAGKLIDLLEAMGIVGPYKGSKSREVLATRDQLPDYFG